jgi:nucleotide-binding universal stress UspA family protein
MLSVRTVLHPTDFSEYSDCAFRVACALALDYGARLVILHVTAPAVDGYGEGIMPPPPADYLEPLRARLHQLQPLYRQITVEHQLVEGDAAAEILRTAAATQCDMIVLGTHGRAGLRRLLMGSTAEQVMRRARCPVLAVKAPLAKGRPRLKRATVEPGTTIDEAFLKHFFRAVPNESRPSCGMWSM